MKIDPSSLTAKQAVQLLTAAGGDAIDAASIQRDIADGAPTNDNGTINLVHYTAWLAREVASQK